MPERAQVVVVGGGILGCSTAYHLTERGMRDVVLVERGQLTSGTTWHAAGLVTTARPTHSMRRIVQRSLEIFESLEGRTGLSTGFRRTGTLHLALSESRREELARVASSARGSGIEVQNLSAAESVGLFPLLNPAGIVASLYFPNDGRGNAADTTMSLARGARMGGARICEGVTVQDVVLAGGRARGVRTSAGDIEAEYVVNCTGMWGRQFAAKSGVRLPLQALHHYYVVTEEVPGMARDMPTVKSGDDWSYVKDEAGKLMVGFFEPGSQPWSPRGIPDDADFTTLPENWEHLAPFYERMIRRIPILEELGIRLFFCGPESFTPDGVYHLGEVSGLRNYFVGAGFNSIGFLSGPGAGQVLADWIVDGRAPFDLLEADPRRSMPHQINRRYLEARVPETLDLAYEVHWPFQQRHTARGIKRSPLHDRVAASGAVFGEVAGWERANWYNGDAGSGRIPPEDQEVGTWRRPPFHEAVAGEHAAVRQGVGLLDVSSFGKLLVQGRDALRVLQRVSANDIDVDTGRVVYTQWLNAGAGIEADLTITRTGEREWLVLTAAACVVRDRDWLERHVGSDDNVAVTDVSGGLAMLSVMGPSSRRLLQPLTDADLSDEAFPFATSREIDLGLGFVRATRLTYVGELGFELLVPSEMAVHVHETIVEAGADLGLRPAGYYALESLRMEKAYRSFGHDVGPFDSPIEAGLGFAVAYDKPGGFIGRQGLVEQRRQGVTRRLVQFALDDPAVLLGHDEPIWREGRIVGRIASAAYGHTIGCAIGLGYVEAGEVADRAWYESGPYEIEVASCRRSARASLRPMYDPRSERVKS